MDRLTYFEGGRWWVRIGDTEHSGPVADRLAAYEDTGLEPGEIETLQKREQGLAELLVNISCGCTVTYGRLQELAQAEKDGRLVVLPCVRPFNNGIYGVAYECLFWREDFGFMTEAFPTRAEAEAALKRQKEEQHDD